MAAYFQRHPFAKANAAEVGAFLAEKDKGKEKEGAAPSSSAAS